MPNELSKSELIDFVSDRINNFHQRRLQKLTRLTLTDVLLRKNPYLFKAKNMELASDLIEGIMQAFLSSSEEPMFGEFLEELAIYIAERVRRGWKSSTEGLDLEFDLQSVRYCVSIKSGSSWGNSSQHKRLRTNFDSASRVLRQNNAVRSVQPVLGICYGRAQRKLIHNYLFLSGKYFWEFISDDPDLYLDIIEPIGYKAKEKNELYTMERSKLSNRLIKEFTQKFCDNTGAIEWNRLVEFNSGANK